MWINTKEMEITSPDILDIDEINRLLSLTELEYYEEILKALGLRACFILTKNKKVKSKTAFIKKLKLVKIKGN